jgi:hypothetical protein
MDIDLIIEEFGAKYIAGGQTEKSINTELFAQDDITRDFMRVPENDTHFRSSYATIDEVLQAFSIPFASKSTTTFKPWEQKLGEFKIDKLITPDKVRQSWLGFLASIEEADRSKWPIIQWYIQKQLLPKAKSDFLIKTAYWGWQVTGYDATPDVDETTFVRELVADTAISPANASMDGIHTQLAKMYAAGRLNTITTGAWDSTPADFVTQVEEFVMQIPSQYRREMDYLYMSEENRNKYRNGRRAKYNMYYAQETDLDIITDTTIKVKGTVSMTGSNQVWCTNPANRVNPTKTDVPARFDIQKLDRNVKLLNDWRMLLTFHAPEGIWTNDQDLEITSDMIDDYYS